MLAGGERQGDQHQEEEEAQGGEERARRVPAGLHHRPQRAHLLRVQSGLLRRDDWLRQLRVQNRVVSLQLCGTYSQAQRKVVLPSMQRRQAECEKDRQMICVVGGGGSGGGVGSCVLDMRGQRQFCANRRLSSVAWMQFSKRCNISTATFIISHPSFREPWTSTCYCC